MRPKKRLSWDPRPNQIFYIQHSSEELASRKAHWRQIESDASRMAQMDAWEQRCRPTTSLNTSAKDRADAVGFDRATLQTKVLARRWVRCPDLSARRAATWPRATARCRRK